MRNKVRLSVSLSDALWTTDSLTVRENMLDGAVPSLNFPVNMNHWSSNSRHVKRASQSATLGSKTNSNSKCGQQPAADHIASSNDQMLCNLGDAELNPAKVSRIFKCPLCDYANSRMYNLNRHMRCHTGQKFRCGMCRAEYNCKYKLQQHRLLKHGFEQNFLLGYDYKQTHDSSAPVDTDGTGGQGPAEVVDHLSGGKASLLQVKEKEKMASMSTSDEHEQEKVVG